MNWKLTIISIKLSCVAMIFAALNVNAQNVSFSQFRAASLFTNPAFVATQSDASLSLQHRTLQLNNEINFNTTALTGSYAFVNENNKRTGGVGFSALRDVQSGSEAFKLQGVSAAYAYNLNIHNKQFISFGMSGGYYERRISSDGFTTGSQWVENVGFDRSAPLGEAFIEDRKSYFTVASGINYYMEDDHGRKVLSLGYAAHHLNRPEVSFLEANEKLYRRHIASGFIALLKSDKVLFGPEVLYINQNSDHLLSPGAALNYNFESKNPFSAIKSGSLDVQARYAVDNAVIMSFQFNQPNFSFGFSYDFGASSSSTLAANSSATEFLITIRKPLGRNKQPQRVVIDNYTLGDIRDFYAKDADQGQLRYFGEDDNNKTGQTPEESAEKVGAEFDWEDEDKFQFELRKDFSFGFNEAELNDEAKAFLMDIFRLLESNDRLYLEVIGHTDNIGTTQANKKVSVARAQAVFDYLVAQGINSKRIKVTGKGAQAPLVDNDTEANREKNRRVEFIIYTK